MNLSRMKTNEWGLKKFVEIERMERNLIGNDLMDLAEEQSVQVWRYIIPIRDIKLVSVQF